MSKSSEGLREVRFLTVAEVAAVMRVSKMTVYRMVHSGELPAVRVGRRLRYLVCDVRSWLDGQRTDPAEARSEVR